MLKWLWSVYIIDCNVNGLFSNHYMIGLYYLQSRFMFKSLWVTYIIGGNGLCSSNKWFAGRKISTTSPNTIVVKLDGGRKISDKSKTKIAGKVNGGRKISGQRGNTLQQESTMTVVSEWLSFNANSAIFQLYHGENKLIFNEMMMRAALY